MPTISLPALRYPLFYDHRIHPDSPKNTALVFLHHATGSSYDWRDQLYLFSKEFNCVAYDRIGFGQSIPDDLEHPSMKTFPVDYYEKCIEELAELVDSLKLDRIMLIGHSDGA